MHIKCLWGDPTNKNSMAYAENSVKQIELGMKYIMAENSLPVEWWQAACVQAAELRNIVSMMKNSSKSHTGDAIRPAEQLSNGRFDRRLCNHIIKHVTTVGTPCLVTMPKTKGSDVVDLARNRWGILHHMVGDLPVFKDPRTGSEFHSKNYVAVDMPEGFSAYEFLGLPFPKLPKTTFERQGNERDNTEWVVTIDDLGGKVEADHDAIPVAFPELQFRTAGNCKQPLLTTIDKDGYRYEEDSYGKLKRTNKKITWTEDEKGKNNLKQRDRTRQLAMLAYNPDYFHGNDVFRHWKGYGVCHGVITGHAYVVPPKSKTGKARLCWQVTYDDKSSEDWDKNEMVKFAIDFIDGQAPTNEREEEMEAEEDESEEKSRDVFENVEVYETKRSTKWRALINALGLDPSQGKEYYDWINATFRRGEDHRDGRGNSIYFKDPYGGGTHKKLEFRKGTRFPKPIGEEWEKWREKKRANDNANNDATVIAASVYAEVSQLMMEARDITKLRRAFENSRAIEQNIFNALVEEGLLPAEYYDDAGKVIVPKNLSEAYTRPDSDLWVKALEAEMKSIYDLGVLSGNYTMRELRDMGMHKPPVPAGLVLTCKYDKAGRLDKYKARFVQLGHPGNMIKGVHYDEVYAAAPNLATSRLIHALANKYGWAKMPFDISTAFLHADTTEREQYPIEMPKGMTEWKDGEKCYRLLLKNLYGSPVAPRKFCECRDSFIREHFVKENGWILKEFKNHDSCLFQISRVETGKKCFLVIHVDDVDLVGESANDCTMIADAFNSKFGIKMCDPEFMLGIERITSVDPKTNRRTTEFKQTDYVSSMYKRWRAKLKKEGKGKPPNTPFPPGIFLCYRDKYGEKVEVPEEETKQVLKDGYQKIVGELLWAQRNCFPECSYGVVQLCTVMSAPTHQAMDAALHMVHYLYGQKHRGIRFSSDSDNDELTAFYDSSDKGDHTDEKAYYGFSLQLFGGPILWEARKHAHVGTSSSHNEYMALSNAGVQARWVREILIEMGFPQHAGRPNDGPTVLMGDNDQATKWSIEDMKTTPFKRVRNDYHWVKEAVEHGEICPRRIATADNIADIFTKSLGNQLVGKFRDQMCGYEELPNISEPRPR